MIRGAHGSPILGNLHVEHPAKVAKVSKETKGIHDDSSFILMVGTQKANFLWYDGSGRSFCDAFDCIIKKYEG